MKKQLLSLVCVASVVGLGMGSGGIAAAQEASPAQALPSTQQITIPQTTGIVILFPSNVMVDAGRNEPYPLTVPLAQAITDTQGNVIAPQNTPVSVLLQPQDGGVKIVTQSLLIGGRIVPVEAVSPLIPGTTITHRRANDVARDNGSVWGRMMGSGFGFMSNGNPDQFDRGAMLGNLIGMVSGMRSPENTRVVQIPQGSVYVLSLQTAIVLSR